jgi:hypothetical protein
MVLFGGTVEDERYSTGDDVGSGCGSPEAEAVSVRVCGAIGLLGGIVVWRLLRFGVLAAELPCLLGDDLADFAIFNWAGELDPDKHLLRRKYHSTRIDSTRSL